MPAIHDRTRRLITAHGGHYADFLAGLGAITGDDVKASEAWAFWELMNSIYEHGDDDGGLKNTERNVTRMIRAAEKATIYKYLKAAQEKGLVVSIGDRKGTRYFLTEEAAAFVGERYEALLERYRTLLKDFG